MYCKYLPVKMDTRIRLDASSLLSLVTFYISLNVSFLLAPKGSLEHDSKAVQGARGSNGRRGNHNTECNECFFSVDKMHTLA